MVGPDSTFGYCGLRSGLWVKRFGFRAYFLVSGSRFWPYVYGLALFFSCSTVNATAAVIATVLSNTGVMTTVPVHIVTSSLLFRKAREIREQTELQL